MRIQLVEKNELVIGSIEHYALIIRDFQLLTIWFDNKDVNSVFLRGPCTLLVNR